MVAPRISKLPPSLWCTRIPGYGCSFPDHMKQQNTSESLTESGMQDQVDPNLGRRRLLQLGAASVAPVHENPELTEKMAQGSQMTTY